MGLRDLFVIDGRQADGSLVFRCLLKEGMDSVGFEEPGRGREGGKGYAFAWRDAKDANYWIRVKGVDGVVEGIIF